MGDIETTWFVARDEETSAFLRLEVNPGLNPFTKEILHVTSLRVDEDALSKQPGFSEPWLMAEDVAELFGLTDRLEPLSVGEDGLYRILDEVTQTFAAHRKANLSDALDAWKAEVATVERQMKPVASVRNLRVVTEMHKLALAVKRGRGSLFGWVRFSGQ